MEGMTRTNDAPVLDQMDGLYQHLFALLLFEYGKMFVVDVALITRFAEAEANVVFTHGLFDKTEFSLITQRAAEEISKFEASRTSATPQ